MKMIPHLKLPFQFNTDKLQEDLHLVKVGLWAAHFNTLGYEGSWSVIPLYAPNGNQANIMALHGDDVEIQPTPVMEKCDYFSEVIRQFPCPVLTARLMKLDPGAYIKPHRDHKAGYEDGMFRIHTPIVTNSDVVFILDKERLEMKPGECWYTNVNFEHSVANKGAEPRVHLVVDYARNHWSDKFFFGLASEEDFFPQEEQVYNAKELIQIIKELESFKDPSFQSHIEALKSELKRI